MPLFAKLQPCEARMKVYKSYGFEKGKHGMARTELTTFLHEV